jgi:hypothetical protein
MSHAYSPDQRNVLPATRCTPSASMLRDFQKSNSDSGKSSPTTPTNFTGREETRAKCSVGRRAAQLVGVFLDGSFDGVECDGANDENRHVIFDF